MELLLSWPSGIINKLIYALIFRSFATEPGKHQQTAKSKQKPTAFFWCVAPQKNREIPRTHE